MLHEMIAKAETVSFGVDEIFCLLAMEKFIDVTLSMNYPFMKGTQMNTGH